MARTMREQFNRIAKEYDENRRKFIPCFDDYYGSATDFIAKSLDRAPESIVDLGAGTGLLTAQWLAHFPNAEYTLVDVAEEMLDVARKRFDGVRTVRYEVRDYAKDFQDEKADAVISALSIHHLEDADKRRLFARIYESLNAGGIFANYDQFCAEDAELNAKIERYWVGEIRSSGISETEYERWQERKKLDRECSVAQEVQWLKDAGFSAAECVYLNRKFAVIVAKK